MHLSWLCQVLAYLYIFVGLGLLASLLGTLLVLTQINILPGYCWQAHLCSSVPFFILGPTRLACLCRHLQELLTQRWAKASQVLCTHPECSFCLSEIFPTGDMSIFCI